MARRIGQNIGGTPTLSYIDMISGGFGSAFFLFLIFVSFPIDTASTPSSGSRFLDIWIEWRDESAFAYTEVEFTPEQSKDLVPASFRYSLNSQTLHRDSSSGLISYHGTAPQFWVGIAEAGFSQTGRGGLMRQSKSGLLRGQWLRFADPCPGTYMLSVGSLSPGDLTELLAASQQRRTVLGNIRVMVSDGENVVFLPSAPPATLDFEYETGLGAQPTQIAFEDSIVVDSSSNAPEASLLHCEDAQ